MSKPTAIPVKGSTSPGSRSSSPMPRDRHGMPVAPTSVRLDRETSREGTTRDRDGYRESTGKEVKAPRTLPAALPAIATPPRELPSRTPSSPSVAVPQPQLSPGGERKTTRSATSASDNYPSARPQSPPQISAAIAKEAATIAGRKAPDSIDRMIDDSARRRSRDPIQLRPDGERKDDKKDKEEKVEDKKDKEERKAKKEKKDKTDTVKRDKSASHIQVVEEKLDLPPLPERKHSEPARPNPALLSPEVRRVKAEEDRSRVSSGSTASRDKDTMKLAMPSPDPGFRRHTDKMSPTSGDTPKKLPSLTLPKADPPPASTSPKTLVPTTISSPQLVVQSAPMARRKGTYGMGSIDMRAAAPPLETLSSGAVNLGTMTPRGMTAPASLLPALELMPSTPKLFPWILWVPDAADSAPVTGTATDFLFKSLLGEFLHVCSKKIADNMSLSLDVQFLLSDVFDFNNDPTFCALLAGLHELSKKHLSQVVRALMTWKTRQITEVEKLKSRLQKDTKTGMSLKEGLVLLEERHQLCVDYTFLSTIRSVFKFALPAYKAALEDQVADQLGDWVFDNLRPSDKKAAPQESRALLTNRKSIPELWGVVLGDLMRERMHIMASKFYKEMVYNNDRARAKATAVLIGARNAKMKLRSKSSLQRSVAFLERYEQLMQEVKKKKDDLLPVLTETLTHILSNSANTPQKEGIDYTNWNVLVNRLFQVFLEKAKKSPKLVLTYHPLCTQLLCVSDNTFFNHNWWVFLESVLLSPKYLKEKVNRGVHFECVRPIVENYFTRMRDPPDALSRLQFISATMYPPTSRKLLTPGSTEDLQSFIELIVSVASAKLDFALVNLLTELIRGPELAPEKLYVGLKAFLRINTPVRPPETPAQAMALEKAKKYHRPQLNVEKAPVHFPKIATHLLQALQALDPLFGWLQINQQKTITELMAKEKVHPPQLCLDIIRTAIACVPIAMTGALPPELLTLLCRYLVHLDKSIQEAAYKTLYTLVQERPDLRASITAALADFSFSIVDKQYELIYTVLHKLALLLKEWETCAASGKDEIKEPSKALPLSTVLYIISPLRHSPIYSKLEAVSLVFLCSPFSNIRTNAIDCLASTAAIYARFAEDAADVPAQRVHDIITEASPDVVQRLHQDYLFRLKNPIINPVENAMEKIFGSETAGAQLCWSFCLADLLKQIITLCPEPVRQAWALVLSRVPAVQPTESDSLRFGAQTDTIEEEVGLQYWSNYILFACAAAQTPEEARKNSTQSNLGPSETLRALAAKSHPPAPLDMAPTMTPKQLLEQVAGALKTENNDAVVMALSRTNPSLYELLFQVLGPIEKEYQTKKGTKRDRLRIDVSSVYAYVSESMKPGTLCSNDTLRKLFLTHMSDTMQFFARPENETIGDSNQFLRYNFCVTVKSVAQELRGQEDRINKGLRKQAFTFLLKWTTGETLLQEEGTKRIAQAMLSQIRDAEAKQDYERKLKESVQILQFSAAGAIGSLLLGPSWDDQASKSDGPVFTWMDRLMEQHQQQRNLFFSSLSLASSAVESFLQVNPGRDLLLNTVINRCYSSSAMIAKGYFTALVELFKGQDWACPLHVLLSLILFKCINADQAVRKSALQLLQLVWLQTQSGDANALNTKWGDAEACMDSHLQHTYCNAQSVLSGRLAQLQPKQCYDLFIHVVMRLEELTPKDQATMLKALLPWIKQMDFRQYVDQHDFVLLNLTVLSLKYDVAHGAALRDLWATFAAEESNVAAIVDFLLKIGDKKRNVEFMTVAKQILLLVARTQPQGTVDALVNELSSLKKRTTSRQVSEGVHNIISRSTDVERQYAYASFNALLPDTANYVPPGRGHLSLILLSELAFEQSAHFKPHLAVVLHQVFLGLDFSLQSFVIEHCRILLLNLVYALGTKAVLQGSDESAVDLVEFLRTKENKQLWAHEDVTLKRPTISSALELRKLVQRVVRCIGVGNKQLTEEWAAEALTWAVSCPSAHLQNRSHQIYRSLQPNVSREALDEILSSTARCIAAHTPESNALLIEILYTLRCIVESLDSNRLMLFTNLFWASVAVLHTDYEEIYCQALSLLNALIERLNWFDRSVQNIFVASTPKEWKPPFIGLQPMVTKGLLSSTAHPTAVELLARFTLLPCHHVFQPDNTRLMMNLLCLLPDIMSAPVERATQWTAALAQAAEKDGRELLSKILHHFTPTIAWLQDLMREYSLQYFPQQTLVTFKCLFRFITKGPVAYHQATLQILRALLRSADTVVFDLLRPRTTVWYGILLQQLNGPYWREVVDILDVSVARVPSTSVSLEPKDLSTFSTFTHNPEWLNVPSDGTQQASGNLAPVLAGAEMHKSEYAVAPEFFAKFFSSADVNAMDQGRSPDHSLRNTTASDETDSAQGSLRSNPGSSTAAMAAAAAAANSQELVQGTGGFPKFTGFDDFLDSLDNLPSNTGPASPKAVAAPPPPADAGDAEYGRSSSFSTLIFKHAQRGKPTKFGSKLPLQTEALEIATQWSESANQTSFPNPSDMFKIFPEATWLLNALREDFIASLASFQKEVQGEENAKLLNSPIMKLAKMETLFKLPIPETSKVILNIISTKYRARLQADSSFERTFKEQRARLLQTLNGQYLAYVEQKIVLEDTRGTVQGPEQSKEWISAVLALHQQLLTMFQTNISVQALITDLLASEPGDTAEEDSQKKVVEEELRANAALGEKIKPAKKRSAKKEKKLKKTKEKSRDGLSAPEDDDGEKIIIAD